MRVALVHDWLVTWRGGEKVLEAIAELFPQAPIYTLFHSPHGIGGRLAERSIRTSWLDQFPMLKSRHRWLLPLLPAAIESMAIDDSIDLVISSSHCVAKGIRVPQDARHLSYVHAPLRYMWDRYDDYFGAGHASLPVRLAASLVRGPLRTWDGVSARGVDRFVANSHFVAGQIRERYSRDAAVVHPPVELERFSAGKKTESYFLIVGAMAPYKRVDLAIEAFRSLKAPLWISGTGQAARQWLRALPNNVKMLGQISDAELPTLYRNARALIFPGVEDFGLTPIEAQASGRPVIAFRGGGVLETVNSRTGLFFDEQTPESLAGAVRAFEKWEETFAPSAAIENAARFSKAAFQAAFMEHVRLTMSDRH